MKESKGERRFKLIKFFRVESEESLDQRLKAIKARIGKMIDWSEVEDKKQIEERFMLFPNESIYNEGIRISTRKKGMNFEIVKGKRQPASEGSILYEYQNTFFYNNPTNIFKAIGYQENTRKHKNATIFRCFKYGLEIVIYENDTNNIGNFSNPVKTAHVEIIESSSREPVNESIWFWSIFQNQFSTQFKPVKAQEINHELMTVKNTQNIDSMINNPIF